MKCCEVNQHATGFYLNCLRHHNLSFLITSLQTQSSTSLHLKWSVSTWRSESMCQSFGRSGIHGQKKPKRRAKRRACGLQLWRLVKAFVEKETLEDSRTCRWCWSCCVHSRWCCRCSVCPAGPTAACWNYCQICWWWLQSWRLIGGFPHARLKTEENTSITKASARVQAVKLFEYEHWSHDDDFGENTFVVSLFLSDSSARSLWVGGPSIVPCSRDRRSNLMLWVKRCNSGVKNTHNLVVSVNLEDYKYQRSK